MYFICVIFYVIVAILNQPLVIAERRCRCLANDATCWPNTTVWQTFNQSVDGRLLIPEPSAAVCHGKSYDANACIVAKAQWLNATWRSDQLGAMQNHNWENSSCSITVNNTKCNQGSVPWFAVNATLPEHVQATVFFAAKNNLRLVIKSTGHDYFGRSGAAESLLLWLHYMKNMTLIEQYSSCDGTNISNAARIDAGVQWSEAYQWLDQSNLTVVGAASGTVSAIGGYLQGGGHSPLSRFKGLAVDQVLEYDVVTADGRPQTVNACQNGDLFWALSGGGGGTYAIVLSAVIRTFQTPSIVSVLYEIDARNEERYSKLIRSFIERLPTLADLGWSGYFSITDVKLTSLFHIPNGDLAVVNATLIEFALNNSDLDFSHTNFTVFPSFYPYLAQMIDPYHAIGYNILLSSRLIPESIVGNDSNKVAEVFLQAKGNSSNRAHLVGSLVAGGQVANTSISNNSVNPGWRTALLHMVYSQGWVDRASEALQKYVAQEVTRRGEILDALSIGSVSSCYLNEADPNELNWQEKFFGTRAIYDKLKSIKDAVDPDGLFVCKTCVGSDDWTSDLNCPKASSSTTSSSMTSILATSSSTTSNSMTPTPRTSSSTTSNSMTPTPRTSSSTTSNSMTPTPRTSSSTTSNSMTPTPRTSSSTTSNSMTPTPRTSSSTTSNLITSTPRTSSPTRSNSTTISLTIFLLWMEIFAILL